MAIVEFYQLNEQQKIDAVSNINFISIETNIPVAGVWCKELTMEVIAQGYNPDKDFEFDITDDGQVEVKYK